MRSQLEVKRKIAPDHHVNFSAPHHRAASTFWGEKRNMSIEVWGATPRASDENTIRGAALSVRQRKLLALLNTPMSIDSLSSLSGIPHVEVEANLQRFEKLGLAQSDAAAAAPSTLRPSSFASAAPAATKSQMPLIIGGVALTAVAAALFFFMRGGGSPAPTAPTPPVASSSTAPAAPIAPSPAAAAPSDGATTSVFVPGSAAPADPAKAIAAKDAPKDPREAAKEAAAKEAAKKAAVATTANPSLTPAAPSPAPAVASAAPPPAAAAPAPAPAAAPAPAPAAPAPATTPAVAAAAPAAAARPAAAPAAAAREGALISRVEPLFPRNAEADRGTVRARLTVNATGAVTSVDILEANPPRVFDRNVRTALAQWRYEGTGETQTKLVEISFAR